MKDVTIYSSSSCHFCKMAKEFLKNKGIEYTEKNISEDPEAKKEMMKMGFTGVPVICVGDETVYGFDKDKIEKLLED